MKNSIIIFALMIAGFNAFALPPNLSIKKYNFVNFLLSPIRLDGMGVSKGIMYALERVQNRLIVLDPEAGNIIKEKSFPEGYEPHSIFVDDNFIYLGVVSRIENEPHFIALVDKETLMERRRILMAYDNYFPSHIWVDKDIAYISTFGDGTDPKILRRNLKSGLSLTEIIMPSTNSYWRQIAMRVTPDGDKLYFSYFGIYRYDLLTQNFFQFPRETVSTPDGGYYFLPRSPNELVIKGNILFATDDDKGIAIVDKNTGMTKAYFPMLEEANGTQPFRCSMIQIVGNRVYVASEQSITVFDLPEDLR